MTFFRIHDTIASEPMTDASGVTGCGSASAFGISRVCRKIHRAHIKGVCKEIYSMPKSRVCAKKFRHAHFAGVAELADA